MLISVTLVRDFIFSTFFTWSTGALCRKEELLLHQKHWKRVGLETGFKEKNSLILKTEKSPHITEVSKREKSNMALQ